jgi:predicted Holliday junction resolvase-like endonuclease
MIFSKIKVYLYTGLGLLVSALLVAVKILTGQNSRLRREVETADARIRHTNAVMKNDIEVDRELDRRSKELTEEIEEKKKSSELENPNDW